MSKVTRSLTALALSTALAGGALGLSVATATSASAGESAAPCVWVGKNNWGPGHKVKHLKVRSNGKLIVTRKKGCMHKKSFSY